MDPGRPCPPGAPLIDAAFAANDISYAKARILTRWADADNERHLLDLALTQSANRLTTLIAKEIAGDETDEERDRRLHHARSVTTYTDGDGMVIIRAALPPQIAKRILAAIAITRQLDHSYLPLMIHDSERQPLDATNRRRFPTTRQKRVLLERHRHQCVDCDSTDLIELDHNPPFAETHHTITTELEPRCAPCHRARHRHEARPTRSMDAPAAEPGSYRRSFRTSTTAVPRSRVKGSQ